MSSFITKSVSCQHSKCSQEICLFYFSFRKMVLLEVSKVPVAVEVQFFLTLPVCPSEVLMNTKLETSDLGWTQHPADDPQVPTGT